MNFGLMSEQFTNTSFQLKVSTTQCLHEMLMWFKLFFLFQNKILSPKITDFLMEFGKGRMCKFWFKHGNLTDDQQMAEMDLSFFFF